MSYQRKVHLYGDPCPSASGKEPPTVLALVEFTRLPRARRCGACDKRASEPPGSVQCSVCKAITAPGNGCSADDCPLEVAAA